MTRRFIACFTPCRGRLTFFVLPKKVSKERRARDGDFPLDLCRGEGKEPNSLRSDKAPSFFLPATKIQGAIKGRKVKGQTVDHQRSRNHQDHAKQSEQQRQK
ncbi:MAG: hypothetical protein C0465_05160 [Ralstonia sp.]|nr:hypothetical protein [Ralstonia sp.]MBA4230011.1 hypothetical protein [Ralstonia sp.]MBA4235134.1 hypothetical protein [Ralstonia sp.]MBA4279826.1 hypothetical protein [Ralstonia sp.]MBA4294933.1 hypothetical protein [Ralstonia sp.]